MFVLCFIDDDDDDDDDDDAYRCMAGTNNCVGLMRAISWELI